ncbi:putative zinc transporter zrg17 [Cyphellophora attinorum]|uniref:Zinc transporter n=1 Tax=Cyphellophora attinorum TaxID=1664694 RepID=A0A0N1NWX8_9EURO|nr:putative zinc transporter zrg17 [Phialophora attinorum]KPI36057.1 putative zinc transporter zrg17 [Phialophora attinorum]
MTISIPTIVPQPPRTPTPPPLNDESSYGPGPIDHDHRQHHHVPTFDPRSLSPHGHDAMDSARTQYFTPASPEKRDTTGAVDPQPFNFQPATLAKEGVSVGVKSNIGQRRGHKYKHSSVSHAIFLEPPPRAPLSLPNSLPIPTFTELRASLTSDQKLRFYWSLCHMFVAGYTAWNTHGSAGMQALSHLIFYDSLGALLVVGVEVYANFEVWSRSSIRHPFGLQRMEVIAGFALSVLLIFFGFDLISHNAKHALEGVGSHKPHHPHKHEKIASGTVDFTAAIVLASTLVSAVGLKNHARIGKAMRFAAMDELEWLAPTLRNPSHFLTISCSAILLLLPLLELHVYEWIDKLLSLTIAVAMLVLGVHLGKNVGSMLLMSYPGTGVAEVIKSIEADPAVRGVEQAKFWQAHYGVGMANLRLRVTGTEESLLKLRERIASLVRNRLSGGYGRGGQRWEVSVQFKVEAASQGVSYGHYLPVHTS